MIGSGLVIVSTVWEASDGRSEPTGGRGADTMEEWLGDSSGRFLDGSIHVITSWWLHWSMLLSSAERSYLRRVRPLPEHRLLVDVRGDCQPIMVIVSLKLSLILDFTTINLSGWGWSKRRSFARALPEHWLYILILMIVLIDAAWRELSIGGHIVYFHFGQNLDFGCEILVAKPDLVLPITFLPRFWPDRLAKSRPIGLNARLINRARWELFKTLLIVLIVALLTEIGPIGCHGGCSSAGWQEGGGGWWMVDLSRWAELRFWEKITDTHYWTESVYGTYFIISTNLTVSKISWHFSYYFFKQNHHPSLMSMRRIHTTMLHLT